MSRRLNYLQANTALISRRVLIVLVFHFSKVSHRDVILSLGMDGETFGDAADQTGTMNDLPDFFAKGVSGDQEFSR